MRYYWDTILKPLYYNDGHPCNAAARWRGPPDWAPEQVKKEHEQKKQQRRDRAASRTKARVD